MPDVDEVTVAEPTEAGAGAGVEVIVVDDVAPVDGGGIRYEVHRLRDLDRPQRIIAALLGLVLVLAPLLAFARFAPGYTVAGDPAVMALRARDVGTDRTPLLGQSSTASAYVKNADYQVNHLGPVHYYLLAPAVRLLGTAHGMLVVSVLIVGSSLLVAAWAIFRQLGRRAGVLAVVVLTAITFTTGAASMVQPLNSVIAGYPLLCSMVLVWCLFCRDVRLLPVAVAFISFTAQQHLSVVPLVVAGLGVGLAGGAVWSWRAGDWADRGWRRGLVRWSALAVAVGLVLWAAPLYQQFTHKPGNLTAAWRFAGAEGRERMGMDAAVRQVVHVLGLPSILYRTSVDGNDLLASVSWVQVVTAGLVLLAVGGLTVLWRRSHPRRAAMAVLVATLVAMGMLTGSSQPPGFSAGRLDFYHWIWPLLLFVLVMLGLGLAELLERVRVPLPWSSRLQRPLRLAVVPLAVVVGAVPALINPSLDRWSNTAEAAGSPIDDKYIDELADAAMIRHDELQWPLVVLSRGQFLFDGFDTALAIELESRGVEVKVSRILDRNVDPFRLAERDTVRSGLVLVVQGTTPRRAPPGELIANIDTESGFDWDAYDELVEQFETVDRIRFDPKYLDTLPEGDKVMLLQLGSLKPEEFGEMLHSPEHLETLLESHVLKPKFDPDLVHRVLDTLPENPRVFRLKLYVLNRPQILAEAGPLELGK